MSKVTVLIADSDKSFSDSLAGFLMENEMKPTKIADMEAALCSLAKDHFDIAIIEFCNPLYREHVKSSLMHRSNGTVVILTCNRYSAETERAARSLSPAFYFVKPIEPNDLFAVILRLSEMKNRKEILALQRMEQREGVLHE
jgi:DNA-binding NtrC family response regulator